MTAPFSRARRPDQKQQRRREILDAARDLATDRGVARVSLGDIATAVGLATSNVLRYFGTREEIYLQITMQTGADWADAAGLGLRTAHGVRETASLLAGAFADLP